MLHKTLIGGLGNQMFQYAALRGMQAKYFPNEGIELAFTAENYRTGERVTKPNLLRDFSLNPYLESETIRPKGVQRAISGLIGCEIQLRQRGCTDIAQRRRIQHGVEVHRQDLLNRFGIYQMQDGYYPFQNTRVQEKYFTGYFESEKFFYEIRDEIKAEFKPIHAPLPANAALYRRMAKTESVCVSVRRGDFVGTDIDGYANICGADYFARAMARMRCLVPNAVFFLFSNDIEWAKKNVPVDGEVYYESGTDPAYETLRLMSACKHFVISNSTFHWWAQYLCKNQGKIVIAPAQWRRNSPRPDIYQSDWELMDV